MKPIHYGIAGVGGFGKFRRARLRAAGSFVPVGGVDIRGEAFTQAEQEEGKPLRRYPSIETMAADPGVEAIFISTPANLHVEQAIIAARAG